ncbi:hypothetical protein FQA39_LY18737 [Lamprigera yunnana]|nr:hypothetical protein FQA39_LY18737 [Lamprigera yunnana]
MKGEKWAVLSCLSIAAELGMIAEMESEEAREDAEPALLADEVTLAPAGKISALPKDSATSNCDAVFMFLGVSGESDRNQWRMTAWAVPVLAWPQGIVACAPTTDITFTLQQGYGVHHFVSRSGFPTESARLARACQISTTSYQNHRKRPARAALQSQRPDQRGSEQHNAKQRGGAVDAALLAQHPHQPDHGGEHREGHGAAEGHHPVAGARQPAHHGGQPTGQQIRQRHAHAKSRPNTQQACAVGMLTARPIDAPMNGAVQGDAMATASTPLKNALVMGCWACLAPQACWCKVAKLKTPARLIHHGEQPPPAAPATTGDCN